MNPILKFESLALDGIYRMSKIKWWLLEYDNEYKQVKVEESKRFMYFIDGNWVRLPDYFDSRTPEDKFLKLYEVLSEISNHHRNEDYFKNELAIYKKIHFNPKKVIEWFTKNEDLWLNQYFMLSIYWFGDEKDEMHCEINLHLNIKLANGKSVFVDRNDFINTIMFTHLCNTQYWNLLESSNVSELKELL
ncbi:hypothetical protein [Winogradskyella forsetii]|uniref:hypothetical protein n=1 Tax=Winogradskyella forsetii TaxID=2686077 RepID=UPI0015B90233|nr:hypothetical protein [Winogradskyella forsetii]